MKEKIYLKTEEENVETADHEENRVVEGRYEYDKDTFRYHRFRIITEAGIEGTIYIPRKTDPIPTRLILQYATPESSNNQGKE